MLSHITLFSNKTLARYATLPRARNLAVHPCSTIPNTRPKNPHPQPHHANPIPQSRPNTPVPLVRGLRSRPDRHTDTLAVAVVDGQDPPPAAQLAEVYRHELAFAPGYLAEWLGGVVDVGDEGVRCAHDGGYCSCGGGEVEPGTFVRGCQHRARKYVQL